MTVELVDTRKVCVVSWDTDVVKGTHASVQAEGEEKRNVDNTGVTNVFFPADYEGDCTLTIKGSKSGEDTGTFHVS